MKKKLLFLLDRVRSFSAGTVIAVSALAVVVLLFAVILTVTGIENGEIGHTVGAEKTAVPTTAAETPRLKISYEMVTPLPAIGAADTKPDGTFTLTLCGKIPYSSILSNMNSDDAERVFDPIATELYADENLLLSDSKMPDYLPGVLKQTGIDIVAVCPDEQGAGAATEALLTQNGLRVCEKATGENAVKTETVVLNGVSSLFISCSEETLNGKQTEGTEREQHTAGIAESIRNARNNGVAFVAVTVFLEPDGTTAVTEPQKKLVMSLCALGADLVICEKEGCLTAPEWVDVTDAASMQTRRALAVYSAGMLLPEKENSIAVSYLLHLNIEYHRQSIRYAGIEYTPVYSDVENGYEIHVSETEPANNTALSEKIQEMIDLLENSPAARR